MNHKFYQLPSEKQQAIIQAGFFVFSRNCYRKCPVGEVASIAHISKSLLFHYFHNKKEFYLFLWEEAAKRTLQFLTQYGCYQQQPFFDMLECGMRAKIQLMKENPEMAAFAIRAYYETDSEVSRDIQASYQNFLNGEAMGILASLDPTDFCDGLDLEMMYREMLYASEGYIWKFIQKDQPLDVIQFERDFQNMLSFWKQIFLQG